MVELSDKDLLAEAEFSDAFDRSAPTFTEILRGGCTVGDFQRRLLIVMRAAIEADRQAQLMGKVL